MTRDTQNAQLVESGPPEGEDLSVVSIGFAPTHSSEMRDLEQALAHISGTGIPVLLVGESGTGKDFIASRIHALSRGTLGPLLRLRCSSLEADQLVGFLDSHSRSQNGNPESATLLLDEVADLNPDCQGILLAALPEGASEVGWSRVLRSRLICTTRYNLEEHYRAGQFREDLYFRISGVCLRVPPLRRRRDDIPSLLHWFVEKCALEIGKPKPDLQPMVLQRALTYDWPGNVRELENFARQVVLLGDTRGIPDFPQGESHSRQENGTAISLKDAAREASRRAERDLILKTLARTRWNRKRAAQELMISYKALLYKLKDISIDAPQNLED